MNLEESCQVLFSEVFPAHSLQCPNFNNLTSVACESIDWTTSSWSITRLMVPPSWSSSLTHWASQESLPSICPRCTLSFSVPYYSVGKSIALVKYNYPWILSLCRRNWPNLEKINNCPGWLCFKDRTLISKAFSSAQQSYHTLPWPTYTLLENHFLLLHTHLMILVLIFS